jgi:hypothetical protein
MEDQAGPDRPLTMWWSLSRPDGGGAHIKISDEHGRWVITDVYVHGPEVTATMLRDVPAGQLNLIMNLLKGWDHWTIAEAHEGTGQWVLADPDKEPSLAGLRKRALHAPSALPAPHDTERPRLGRPDGTDPDRFYALVAAAYREYAPQTRAPAVEIAREAAVPVGTARVWVREARRRGKLPPGRKGKAG